VHNNGVSFYYVEYMTEPQLNYMFDGAMIVSTCPSHDSASC
jgi:hypothetical protein